MRKHLAIFIGIIFIIIILLVSEDERNKADKPNQKPTQEKGKTIEPIKVSVACFAQQLVTRIKDGKSYLRKRISITGCAVKQLSHPHRIVLDASPHKILVVCYFKKKPTVELNDAVTIIGTVKWEKGIINIEDCEVVKK
jgi:hypothetical protein